MKKLLLIPLIVLTLMPPMDMLIPVFSCKEFLWAFIIFAFFGISTLFTDIHISIKVFIAYILINVFLTRIPFLSQFSYMEFVLCMWFYILCRRESFDFFFKTIGILSSLNSIFLIFQLFNKDSILNWSLHAPTCFGVVGNSMNLTSISIIFLAILIQGVRIQRKTFIFILSILGVASIAYYFFHNVGPNFLYARGPVWLNGIRLSIEHPFVGYGIGSWKALFPTLATGHFQAEGIWYTSHNLPVQLLFETGLIGISLFAWFIKYVISQCKSYEAILGCLLISYTCMFHYPDRNASTVLPLIVFIALITKRKNHDNSSTANTSKYCEFGSRTS